MADFQKGDFLISKDVREVSKDCLKKDSFHIFTGKYTHSQGLCPLTQIVCDDIILGRSVMKGHGTYSHFYRLMNPDEKKLAIEVLNDIDYDFNEETLELIRRPIIDINDLKKRLTAFLEDSYSSSKSERETLLIAIKTLL